MSLMSSLAKLTNMDAEPVFIRRFHVSLVEPSGQNAIVQLDNGNRIRVAESAEKAAAIIDPNELF